MRGSLRGSRRPGSAPRRKSTGLRVERLEERQLLATFTVTNTGDLNPNGTVVPGSLRDAINQANTAPGADTIAFSIGTGQKSILPTAPLPTIIDTVTIDGTTHAQTTGPGIEINGSLAGSSANGLRVDASGTTIRGLVINRFQQSGILLESANNNIFGNFIGTSSSGSLAAGNGGAGLVISGTSGNNIGSATTG